MARTIFGNFSNGIGASKYDHQGFDSLVGVDIHSEPGSVKSSLAMFKESDTTVTELVLHVVELPNGDSFWPSSTSGKIWKRSFAGSWSLVHTNTQGACKGIGYHNGYLYYASDTKLGRIAESNASSESSWSSHNDSWQTLNSGEHPMVRQNLKIYIANGYVIAQVDETGSWNSNALDLQSHQKIVSLFPYEFHLLTGTRVGSRSGINCFIDADNILFCQVGSNGDIYYYDGKQMDYFKKLRDGSNVMVTDVHPYAAACLGNQRPGIFRWNTSGDTWLVEDYVNEKSIALHANTRGIFSIGKARQNLPYALAIEYVSSAGQGVTPGALLQSGDIILWARGKSGDYGVDAVIPGESNRYNGQITTPMADGKFSDVIVYYDSLPANTSIGIEVDIDGSGFVSKTTEVDATRDRIVHLKTRIKNKSTLQARVTLNSYQTSTPVIKAIEFI